MARLTTLRPAVSALAPRLGHLPDDGKAKERARNDAAPWRAWYGTRRWAALRMQAFVRDGFVCQRTGALLVGRHPDPNSPVANHRRPHRGDPALFWDLDNIETVSKAVHDSEIQREEQAVLTGRWT